MRAFLVNHFRTRMMPGLLVPLAAALGMGLPLQAKMASPLLDRPGRPFSWAAYPTDEIGIADARAATEITPSGYLYTGYGEMMFMAGQPARPVHQRLRTLEDGYLPIVHYHFHKGTIRYSITLFSWALNSQKPYRNAVNFIRVRAFNEGTKPATSHFVVAFPYTGGQPVGSHRFMRPAGPDQPGNYVQYGVPFDNQWEYGFAHDCAVRAGEVVYTFPMRHGMKKFLAPGLKYDHSTILHIQPNTPVLMANYVITLRPGQQTELDFKMPVHPIALTDRPALQQLQNLKLPSALAAARRWWRGQLRGRGLQLSVSEKKVVDTFRASLMYLMLARDRWPAPGPGRRPIYVQNVNKLQYHAFWLRDGSYMTRAYDLTDHAHRAAQCLRFFLHIQKPDGNFISQSGQHDGWGEALWAIGQHYQLTGNLAFARKVFPNVRRAVAWLEAARKRDTLHVLPGGNPHDDEFPNTWAHITGDNFYALDGLHEAIILAEALGRQHTAAAWRKQYLDYHHVLFQILRKIGRHDDNYMPPGLDVKGGNDWANLLALYPHELLPPMNPLVTGTLQESLRHYGEGLMTYAGRLHQYLTMNNTETWIIRGQQRHALREVYAVLVHTSSTQAGWELASPPWTMRDFGGDLAPHGWFAADYIAVVRNMLLRSHDQTLNIFSVLSPAWTRPGDLLSLRQAPTRFGMVSLYATFTSRGMRLYIESHFRQSPKLLRLHLPWYVTVTGATVDGHKTQVSGQSLVLPPETRSVRLHWSRQTGLGDWSYHSFVKRFEKAWQTRYFTHKAMAFGNGRKIWPQK
ncbi:MAG: hypothetical protein ACP5VQ_06920 [Phycisphaerae bacterium]